MSCEEPEGWVRWQVGLEREEREREPERVAKTTNSEFRGPGGKLCSKLTSHQEGDSNLCSDTQTGAHWLHFSAEWSKESYSEPDFSLVLFTVLDKYFLCASIS